MSEQRLDLENTMSKLRKIITDMTAIMKEQFEEKFKEINKTLEKYLQNYLVEEKQK